MRMQLFVYHRDLRNPHAMAFPDQVEGQLGAVTWSTCVRSMVIAQNPMDFSDAEVYSDEAALQFLSEVVCGLRSPMLGETEVQGQFKILLEKKDLAISPELFLKLKAVQFLARKIRKEFLQGIGAQSYGSFARKKLSEYGRVAIIGAGHLANEIIPWLAKGQRAIEILARDPEKCAELAAFKNVKISPITEMSELPSALVIAAPLSADAVKSLFHAHVARPVVTLDLRSESRIDPLCGSFNAIALEGVFDEIEKNRLSTSEKVLSAKNYIATAVKDLESAVGRQVSSAKVS